MFATRASTDTTIIGDNSSKSLKHVLVRQLSKPLHSHSNQDHGLGLIASVHSSSSLARSLGLLVSLVANVMGAMSLAFLLATAALNAIWSAVAFRVGINVLSALLMLILQFDTPASLSAGSRVN